MFEDLKLDDLVIRASSHTPFFGVYLATHAILDGLCMCHASVGCKVKTELHLVHHDGVQDAHNRRRYSQFIDEDLINGSTTQLEEEIVAWHARQKPGVIVIDSATPISLQGQPMTGVIRRAEEATGAHVVHVDARNYEDDLYAGWAQTLGALLQRQAWEGAARRADEVSILGYPFERYEPDHRGNVSELRRLLFGLGFKARAVLFAGERYGQLQEVVHARAHIVLPYAHSQAKVYRKLGLDAVRTGLPMSIGGTRSWLRQVGRHLGVERRAEALVEQELELHKALFELARRALSRRRFAVFAEPLRAAGVVATLMEVGMRPVMVGTLHFSLGGRERVERELKEHHGVELPEGVQWLENPTPSQVRAADLGACEVVVGTSIERELLASRTRPWVEFGFPSTTRHHLFPAPWLGFMGALRLIEQVMHALEGVPLFVDK